MPRFSQNTRSVKDVRPHLKGRHHHGHKRRGQPRRFLSRALALGLVGVLALGTTGCGSRGPSISLISDAPVLKPEKRGGQIAEVSPPAVIQELRQSLANYQPQVQILSPRPDELLESDRVEVRLQVTDLNLFQDPDLGLGPNLQIFLDDKPYESVFSTDEPLVFENLTAGSHTIRAFAARPWHEGFKNEGAYAQTTFHVFTKTPQRVPDPELPLITYGSPQGSYGAEPILLDFFLNNAPLHLVAEDEKEVSDWKIRCTINGESFVIDRWQPIYLKGFQKGKNWLKLEYLDEKGEVVDNVFNTGIQIIDYQPGGDDSLSKLVRNRLSLSQAMAMVDPSYKAVSEPAEIESPQAEQPGTESQETDSGITEDSVSEDSIPEVESSEATLNSQEEILEQVDTTPSEEEDSVTQPETAIITPPEEEFVVQGEENALEPTPSDIPEISPAIAIPDTLEAAPAPEAKQGGFGGFFNRFTRPSKEELEPSAPEPLTSTDEETTESSAIESSAIPAEAATEQLDDETSQAEEERIAAEKAEAERLEAESIAAEKAEAERSEAAPAPEAKQGGFGGFFNRFTRPSKEELEPPASEPLTSTDEETTESSTTPTEAATEQLDDETSQAEEERIAAEKAEAERLEAERLAAEKAEEERIAAEKAEAERLEAERIAAEKAEQERIAAEKAKAERLEAERIAAEKAEAERLEAKRVAAAKAEAERLEAERIAAEKAEQERIAAEKAEAERLEAERIAAEKAEAERLEAERIAAEKAEAERIAAEKAEAERIAAEKAEAERIAAEKAEAERLEAERLAAEKAEAERLEAERIAAEKAEAERLKAEQEKADEALDNLNGSLDATIPEVPEQLSAPDASSEAAIPATPVAPKSKPQNNGFGGFFSRFGRQPSEIVKSSSPQQESTEQEITDSVIPSADLSSPEASTVESSDSSDAEKSLEPNLPIQAIEKALTEPEEESEVLPTPLTQEPEENKTKNSLWKIFAPPAAPQSSSLPKSTPSAESSVTSESDLSDESAISEPSEKEQSDEQPDSEESSETSAPSTAVEIAPALEPETENAEALPTASSLESEEKKAKTPFWKLFTPPASPQSTTQAPPSAAKPSVSDESATSEQSDGEEANGSDQAELPEQNSEQQQSGEQQPEVEQPNPKSEVPNNVGNRSGGLFGNLQNRRSSSGFFWESSNRSGATSPATESNESPTSLDTDSSSPSIGAKPSAVDEAPVSDLEAQQESSASEPPVDFDQAFQKFERRLESIDTEQPTQDKAGDIFGNKSETKENQGRNAADIFGS